MTTTKPRKRAKYHKSTKKEIMERRKVIFRLMVNGYDTKDIYLYAAKQHKKTGKAFWGVSKRTLETDMQLARKELEMIAHIRKWEELGRSKARLDNLYQRAISVEDVKAALAVERTRIDLFKLDEVFDSDDDDQIEELIAALEMRVKRHRAKIQEQTGKSHGLGLYADLEDENDNNEVEN